MMFALTEEHLCSHGNACNKHDKEKIVLAEGLPVPVSMVRRIMVHQFLELHVHVMFAV